MAGTPPEGPALERERDTAIDIPDKLADRRRRGPSLGHDRTMTPVQNPTADSELITLAGSPGAKVKELEPGTMVGEYRIEGILGEGGMGRVYSAIHPVIGKKAAIKVLHPRMSMNPEVVDRFVQEARAVNQIGHPNIVDIFSFGKLPDGQSYFVMEWLKGESMQERIRREPLTLAEVCHYITDISYALEAAHEKDIVHRDLKPENVFLHQVKGDRLQIKLLDFGIAKLSTTEDNRIERTRTGAMMGTPKYIAPEQARGYAVDPRADIYSLGVMLFELVARRLPFVADNAMDLIAAHLHDDPPLLSSLVAGISRPLDDLAHAMLAKEASMRPSLARVRQVLEEVRALPPGDAGYTVPDLSPHVGAAPTIYETAPRKSKRMFVIAAALLTIVVGGVLVVRSIEREPEADPTMIARPEPPPSPPPAAPPIKPPEPPPTTVAPEPSRVTVVLARKVPGTLTVDDKEIAGTSPWLLELPPGAHTIKFKPRSGASITRAITLEPGMDLAVELAPAAPSGTNPPKPPKPPKPPTGGGDDDFLAPTKKPK